jgi:RNA polymerase sigma-70 factor (ECF subfamily)
MDTNVGLGPPPSVGAQGWISVDGARPMGRPFPTWKAKDPETIGLAPTLVRSGTVAWPMASDALPAPMRGREDDASESVVAADRWVADQAMLTERASDSRMDPDRERDLVARAAADPAAFGELYDYYLPRIYGFVARRIPDRSVVEDLTAATFERALVTLRGGRFRNESFGGWLYRVAANAVVDHARRERRLVRLPTTRRDDDTPPADEPGDERATAILAAALDRDELRRALLGLSESQRRLLVLRFLDDLTVDELCAVLGCTRGALAVRLHRALRALRAALNGASTDVA